MMASQKVPISCDVELSQTLDILDVWSRAWKITTSCLSKFLLSHPVTLRPAGSAFGVRVLQG